MPHTNKRLQAISARKHYEKNREKMKARARVWTQANRVKVRAFLCALKESAPCGDCGRHFPHYVMDFDHVRGEKKFTIAGVVGRTISLARTMGEIAKCELVCANCHRVRTHARKQNNTDAR